MASLVDTKSKSGALVDVKPVASAFLDTKPKAGAIYRLSEDDQITRLFAGMPIGPGFFMFITYPTLGSVYP